MEEVLERSVFWDVISNVFVEKGTSWDGVLMFLILSRHCIRWDGTAMDLRVQCVQEGIPPSARPSAKLTCRYFPHTSAMPWRGSARTKATTTGPTYGERKGEEDPETDTEDIACRKDPSGHQATLHGPETLHPPPGSVWSGY